jgi:tetratricopeptide (TPR) repeat protein
MAAGYVMNRNRKVPAEETPAFGAIAERFRRAGELERAVELCRDGLRRFPDHLSAQVTLGWSLMDLGRYDEARTALERVLKRAPDNLAAIRGLAELHDRAEHTMMLPMDGPGQWPPPMDDLVEDPPAPPAPSYAAAEPESPAEERAFATESFPPPMAMPIPAPAVAAAIEGPALASGDVDAPDLEAAFASAAFEAADPEAVALSSPVFDVPEAPATAYDTSVFDATAVDEVSRLAAALEHDTAPVVPEATIEHAGVEVAAAQLTTDEDAAFGLDAEIAPAPVVMLDAVADAADASAPAALDASLSEVALDAAELSGAPPEIAAALAADVAMPELEASIAELTANVAAVELESGGATAAAAGTEEDPAEIAALEALIAEASVAEAGAAEPTVIEPTVPEASIVAASVAESAVAEASIAEATVAEAAVIEPAVAEASVEVEEDAEPAFQLTAQSVSALGAMEAAAEAATIDIDEPRAAGEMPLIVACEQWVPEPEPELAVEDTVIPFVAAPAPNPAVVALERFLRRVEARRLHLAAQSVA